MTKPLEVPASLSWPLLTVPPVAAGVGAYLLTGDPKVAGLAVWAGAAAGMTALVKVAEIAAGGGAEAFGSRQRMTAKAAQVRVSLMDADRKHETVATFGVSEDTLRQFAVGIVTEGRGTAQASWQGDLRVVDLNRIRTEMLQRKLAVWRSPHTPARGWIITPRGRKMLTALVSPTPPPASLALKRRVS